MLFTERQKVLLTLTVPSPADSAGLVEIQVKHNEIKIQEPEVHKNFLPGREKP